MKTAGNKEAAALAAAQTGFVSTVGYTGASLIIHLARQVAAEGADDCKRCGDTDCVPLAEYIEWVADKLRDDLENLRKRAEAAGWVEK